MALIERADIDLFLIILQEQVNISDLARVAVSETGVSNPGVSKPTFAVVVKSPCLAVKYSTGNAYVREFHSTPGYEILEH